MYLPRIYEIVAALQEIVSFYDKFLKSVYGLHAILKLGWFNVAMGYHRSCQRL